MGVWWFIKFCLLDDAQIWNLQSISALLDTLLLLLMDKVCIDQSSGNSQLVLACSKGVSSCRQNLNICLLTIETINGFANISLHLLLLYRQETPNQLRLACINESVFLSPQLNCHGNNGVPR
jgi:hypothetical protein